MFTNPHTEKLQALGQDLEKTRIEHDNVLAQLQWYKSFKFKVKYNRLSALRREIDSRQKEYNQAEQAINSLKAELQSARVKATKGFDPFYWISSERIVAERLVKDLEVKTKTSEQSASSLCVAITKLVEEEGKLAPHVKKYQDFNTLEAESAYSYLSATLDALKTAIDSEQQSSRRWESMLGEEVRRYDIETQELRKLENNLHIVTGLNDTWQSTTRAEVRRKICNECIDRFGIEWDKPAPLLRSLRAQYNPRKRGLEKLVEHIQRLCKAYARNVQTLILDGNNLCYASQPGRKPKRIGLAALDALVPQLAQNYTVILFFDSEITKMTKMSIEDIKGRYPQAIVEVMQGTDRADPSILAAAEHSESSFVISNDVFGDFMHRAAIRNGRVMKHYITGEIVEVRDLNVEVKFEIPPGKAVPADT